MKQRRVKTDPQLYIHLIYNRDDTGQRIVLKKRKLQLNTHTLKG